MMLLLRIAVFAVLVSCCCSFLACADTTATGTGSTEGRDSGSITVELYGVAEQQSQKHVIPFVARDGKTWYREATPVLTLSDVIVEKTSYSMIFDDSEWQVELHVKESSGPRLKKWSGQRIGRDAAFFVDGKPGKICQMFGRGHQYVFITGLWSEAEAEQLAARIRSTSIPPTEN